VLDNQWAVSKKVQKPVRNEEQRERDWQKNEEAKVAEKWSGPRNCVPQRARMATDAYER